MGDCRGEEGGGEEGEGEGEERAAICMSSST